MRRILGLLSTLWRLVGIALLCLLAINALLLWLLPDPPPEAAMQHNGQVPAMAGSDAFADAPEQAALWAEFEAAAATRWRAYSHWRRQPFAGRLINVDAHGFRQGWQNPEARADAAEIWVFGGSLVWGSGVPDQLTLPSQLAKLHAEQRPGTPVRVYNFGESGHVSGQGRIAFAQALACRGRRPALAVFVDGAEDVLAALQSGEVGLPTAGPGLTGRGEIAGAELLPAWLSRLNGFARLGASPDNSAATPPDPAQLAEALVQRYLEHVRQSGDLAAASGVRTLFVWQPHLYSKVSQSDDEQRIAAAAPRGLRALQLASDTALATRVRAGLVPVLDLSGLFRDVSEPLFGDIALVNAAGLANLAEVILGQAPPILGPNRPAWPVDRACPELPVAQP